jgi:hypothetical protein
MCVLCPCVLKELGENVQLAQRDMVQLELMDIVLYPVFGHGQSLQRRGLAAQDVQVESRQFWIVLGESHGQCGAFFHRSCSAFLKKIERLDIGAAGIVKTFRL